MYLCKRGCQFERIQAYQASSQCLAHGNVEFDDSNLKQVICIFSDAIKDGKIGYTLKITTGAVGELVKELIIAQQSYVEDIVKRQQEAEK